MRWLGIEERIERLEKHCENLLKQAEDTKEERWVTPSELAEIMNCSTNNIYIKIRKGEIYATDKLGSIKRIPMSQFYQNGKKPIKKESNPNKELSIKELVFGTD